MLEVVSLNKGNRLSIIENYNVDILKIHAIQAIQ
jgi:hypothetical protein